MAARIALPAHERCRREGEVVWRRIARDETGWRGIVGPGSGLEQGSILADEVECVSEQTQRLTLRPPPLAAFEIADGALADRCLRRQCLLGKPCRNPKSAHEVAEGDGRALVPHRFVAMFGIGDWAAICHAPIP